MQITGTRQNASQRVAAPVLSNDQLNAEQIEVAARGGDLDEVSVSTLISFFEILDRWDREAKHNAAEIM
jgi:hypothetical protein